jgi:glycosyltransferase involved in cell wall biosynthesis
MTNDKDIKVLVVGSIEDSPFVKTDVILLSEFFKVDTVNIIGGFGDGIITKIIQIMKLLSLMLFVILPKVRNNDVIYIWFADVHALFCIWCARLFHKKTIVAIGGYEVCDMPEIDYGFQRKSAGIRGKISRMVLKGADAYIIPSQSYYERSLKYVDRNKLYLLSTATRLKYPDKFSDKNEIVLTVGSATLSNYKLKGIPVYDEVASRINVPCYFIGSSDKWVEDHFNYITYLGKMDHEDVIKRMSIAKVYCQLSYTESYGISVMEAMACGCIPVVSDRDNLGELVEGNKFSICSNDTEEIVMGIQHILDTAKDSDCIDMFNLAKMKINFACAERKFGLQNLIRDMI